MAETIAKDAGAKKDVPPFLDNIGFMKNPPKKLREKFPMCNAFLKVEWIDRDKKIGYTEYEARLFNDKGILQNDIKKVWALVNLDDEWPSYTLDVYQYKQQRRMKELYEIVKYGKPTRVPMHFAIKYKGDLTVFYDPISPVLSDHQQTVCIAYPDKQRAWIVEGKSVKQTYSSERRDELSKKIKESGKPFSNKWLESLWILDINFDGKEDFVIEESFVATWSNKLYLGDRVYKHPGFQLIFQPNGRSCRLNTFGTFPLTTDGKNYYISNQCNLTELTSNSEKE